MSRIIEASVEASLSELEVHKASVGHLVTDCIPDNHVSAKELYRAEYHARRVLGEKGSTSLVEDLKNRVAHQIVNLRTANRYRLLSGQSIDPVSNHAKYENILTLGMTTQGVNDNAQVMLRNAVVYPEQFNYLDTYANQKEALANLLCNLGTVSTHDMEIAMTTPYDTEHISEPGTAGLYEAFELRVV